MNHRRVGASSLSVSTIGLGAWMTFGHTISQRDTTAIVRKALDLGITFFDTADVYGGGTAESSWGKSFDGVKREHYVLATKCFFPTSEHMFDRGLSRRHIRKSIEGSLERLRTDHVDLYQCHRFDPETPLEELVRTMDDLVSSGKILHWGVSYWGADQINSVSDIAARTHREPPISNQPPYNLLERGIEPEVVPACKSRGLSQVVFSPLAQGVLSGKYRGGQRPPASRAANPRTNMFMDRYFDTGTLAKVDRAREVAERAGFTLPQIALAWCLRDPNVASVIVGVTSEAQLVENAAAGSREVPADLIAEVDRITAGGAP